MYNGFFAEYARQIETAQLAIRNITSGQEATTSRNSRNRQNISTRHLEDVVYFLHVSSQFGNYFKGLQGYSYLLEDVNRALFFGLATCRHLAVEEQKGLIRAMEEAYDAFKIKKPEEYSVLVDEVAGKTKAEDSGNKGM